MTDAVNTPPDESFDGLCWSLAEIFSQIPGFSETPIRRIQQETCHGCDALTITVELENENEFRIRLAVGRPIVIDQVWP